MEAEEAGTGEDGVDGTPLDTPSILDFLNASWQVFFFSVLC